MPDILEDKRDPVKRELGIKLREMKRDNPEELKKILSAMTEQEARDILYDPEIWSRDSQWVDLSAPNPITTFLTGRGLV